MIILDTHVLVGLRAGDRNIGKSARREIEKAHLRGEVAVSAISFWEVAMLIIGQRLKLRMSPADWRRTVLDDGVVEVPLSGEIGIRSTDILPHHADPADRMIVATAAVSGAILYTADSVLLGSKLPMQAIDSTI